MDHGPAVTWDDIAGLDFVKKTVKEIVIWPMLRPYVRSLASDKQLFWSTWWDFYSSVDFDLWHAV